MNIKNEQGITILALIITVVVMTILASIVISTSVEDNGLIALTKKGTIIASIREVQEAIDAYTVLEEKDELEGKININSVEVLKLEKEPYKKYNAEIENSSNEIVTLEINRYDLNGDGVVNKIDVKFIEVAYCFREVLKYFQTKDGDENWEEAKKYDYNKDGIIYTDELVTAEADYYRYKGKYNYVEQDWEDSFNRLPRVFDLKEDGYFTEEDINVLKQQYYTYRITPEGLKKMNIKGDYGKGTANDAFYVKKYATEEMEVYYVDSDGVEYTAN